MKTIITTTINGKRYSHEVEGRTLLVDFLRDTLGLTGTHVGCDTSNCGSCTILMNGKAVKSCTLLAAQADGVKLTTIEGLSMHGKPHPLQTAFKEKHGLQCGFCTPGIIMLASDFLKRNPDPNEQEIRASLIGNFCRCTGYHNIVRSISSAAQAMKSE